MLGGDCFRAKEGFKPHLKKVQPTLIHALAEPCPSHIEPGATPEAVKPGLPTISPTQRVLRSNTLPFAKRWGRKPPSWVWCAGILFRPQWLLT